MPLASLRTAKQGSSPGLHGGVRRGRGSVLVGEWRRKEGRRYESVAVLFHRWRRQPRTALARTISTGQLEWGDTRGRIRPARRRSLYPFGAGGGASVRSANEVPRSSAAARVGMGSAWRARSRPARCVGSERGSESPRRPSPTRRRSRERHDALVGRGEGLRLHLDRGGGGGSTCIGAASFPVRLRSVVAPAHAVRLAATVQNGERVAIDVSMAPEVAHGRARRRSSNTRSMWP